MRSDATPETVPASDPGPQALRPRERLRRRRRREGVAVVTGSLVLAVLMTWPQARHLGSTAPGDLGDPLYFAYQLGWVSHALASDPLHLWTTNSFQGMPNNLAFTDTMLGYAPLGVLGGGMTGALRQLNVATILATALASIGAYALARALGARVPGALVAGAGFAYAPWRLEQIVHLNVYSTGGMALSLAFLLRGHAWSLRHGWRPARLHAGWIAAGWAVACWQITLGFAIGIVYGYVLAGTVALLVGGWLLRSRIRLPRRVVIAELGGGAAFAALAAYLTMPYFQVIKDHPEAKRDETWLPLFSPPWRGFFTAPDSSVMWGTRQEGWRADLSWPPEMVLLPGFALMALALAGLLVSSWPWRRRLAVGVATAVMWVLAFGTQYPGNGRYTFLPVYHTLPGWDAMRTPGRLIIWVTLGLCLLAAGAVSWLTDLAFPRGEAAASRADGSGGDARFPKRPHDGHAAGRADDIPTQEEDMPAPEGDGPAAEEEHAPEEEEHAPGARPDAAVDASDDGGDVAPGVTAPDGSGDTAPDESGDTAPDPDAEARPAGPRGSHAHADAHDVPSRVLAALTAVVLLLPAAAVVWEGRGRVPQWEVDRSPISLAAQRQPLLMLPSDLVLDYHLMLWSADGWPTIANGDSGFSPARQDELRASAASFPDVASVAALRERGIRTVVVLPDYLPDTAFEEALDRPTDGLGITRRDLPGAVVFDLG